MASVGDLSVRLIRSAVEADAAVEGMAGLSKAPFYYRKKFLEAYQRHPVQSVVDSFYLEVLDKDGRLVAFSPCYLQGDPLGAFGPATDEISLLSHCWHCYDTRLLAADPTPDLVRLLMDTMGEQAGHYGVRRYGFINVESGSADADAMEAAGLTPAALDTRYVLDLSGFDDEEAYLASLRPRPRHEYRRQLNRAGEAGVSCSARRTSPDEAAHSLRLLEVSATRAGSSGYYDAERIAAFLRVVGDATRVVEIAVDGQLVAIGICFLEADRLHTWAAGYDRERKLPFSPYYVLYAASVRLALEHGVPLLEGGRRNDQFKRRYGMAPRSLLSFTRTRGAGLGRVGD